MKSEVRAKTAELVKTIDKWVEDVERDIQTGKDEVSDRAKDLASITTRERKIKEQLEVIEKERILIEKEKKANRVRSEQIDIKEKDLNKKIDRLRSDFGDLKPM